MREKILKTLAISFLVGITFSSCGTGWRDNIKTKYDNPTEVYIDELFNNWQD